jgi:hypothetical protein
MNKKFSEDQLALSRLKNFATMSSAFSENQLALNKLQSFADKKDVAIAAGGTAVGVVGAGAIARPIVKKKINSAKKYLKKQKIID